MDIQQDLITIIVPVYNGQRYIEECVDSIRKQTYKNIEIIIVNDGSTDASAELLNQYAECDERIKVIHKTNSGVSDSRNKALDIAKGKYFCFVDQDDYIDIEYVSYFYTLIRENNVEIALTPKVCRIKGEKGTQNELEEKNCQNNNKVSILTGQKAAIQMLYYKFVIAPWNKMISRDLIEKYNIRFDERFFSGEGFLFSIECLQRADKVAVGNREIYYYRLDNPDSGMTKFSISVINSSINAQKIIKSRMLNKDQDTMNACTYANWHTYCDCYNTFVGCKAIKLHQDIYKKLKKICRKDAICSFHAPVARKEKIKGLCYLVNPYFAACLINKFRIRKFTVSE